MARKHSIYSYSAGGVRITRTTCGILLGRDMRIVRPDVLVDNDDPNCRRCLTTNKVRQTTLIPWLSYRA